ncbi:MAG: hypothetical protein QM527_11105, partial [Alphaproteobacteria bacterium]|nr:hypothetical protein [Alphaproteobacteria bacterium]
IGHTMMSASLFDWEMRSDRNIIIGHTMMSASLFDWEMRSDRQAPNRRLRPIDWLRWRGGDQIRKYEIILQGLE